jgi:hypothetical protein
MDLIGAVAASVMWIAGLAGISFWIYGFCHLVSAWFADDAAAPSGFMLFDSGPRELLWPTIQATPSRPLSAAAIHRRKARRAVLLFVGAAFLVMLAGTVITSLDG